MKDLISAVKKTPLFSGISDAELDAMLGCINPQVKYFERGEIAARALEPMTGIGLVLSGEVEVMREDASGSRHIISLLGSGDTFGEMSAFSGHPVWQAAVTAKTDCTIMFIPMSRFLGNCPRSCQSHKTLIQNMLRIISDRAILLSRKVEYLSIKGMRPKICGYLLEQYKASNSLTFVLPMNKSDLADYLGVSRPSMVREFSRLKDEGVIDFYLSSVRILDLEALKKFAV